MIKRTGILLLWLTATLMFIAPAAAQSDADDREIGVYLPQSYDEDGDPVSVAIVLHGFGMTPRAMRDAVQFDAFAEATDMMLVFPAGHLLQWNDGRTGDHYEDDVQFLLDLIDELDAEYQIDRDSIYLIGFSNGGIMAYRAACEAPDTFAAIVSVAGLMYREQSCPQDAATSVLIVQLLEDTVVPFAGRTSLYGALDTFNLWARLNDCAGFDRTALNEDDFLGIETTSKVSYEDCEDGAIVSMYLIPDLPHTFPGAFERMQGLPVPEAIDTNAFIFSFLQQVEASRAASDEGENEE